MNQNYKKLMERRIPYTSRAVLAAIPDMSPDTLTNLIVKRGIGLASKSAGQGKGRPFCLIDIYMLGITMAYLKLTDATVPLIQGLNSHFEPLKVKKYKAEIFKENPETRSLTRRQDQVCEEMATAANEIACSDPGKRHSYFTNRNLKDPDYLALSRENHFVGPYYFIRHTKNVADVLAKSQVVTAVNVTDVLTEIDENLVRWLEG